MKQRLFALARSVRGCHPAVGIADVDRLNAVGDHRNQLSPLVYPARLRAVRLKASVAGNLSGPDRSRRTLTSEMVRARSAEPHAQRASENTRICPVKLLGKPLLARNEKVGSVTWASLKNSPAAHSGASVESGRITR